MTQKTSDHSLPHVECGANEGLSAAIQAVVLAKRMLNDVHQPQPVAVAMGVLGRELPWTFFDHHPAGEAVFPMSFVQSIIPFLDQSESLRPSFPAMIPVRQTVGSSWKWSPHNPNLFVGQSVDSLVQFFIDPKRATDNHPEKATVSWIKPLGLFFVKVEGKNRVAFLAHNGIQSMPAEVEPMDYPSADRLGLLEVNEGGLTQTLCMLDQRLVVPLHHPSWSLPILEAYGVGRAPWPQGWPNAVTVMAKLRNRQPSHEYSYPLPHLEISLLPARGQGGTPKPIFQSLAEHQDILWHPKPLVVALGLLVSVTFVATWLPSNWPVRDWVFGFAVGVVAGAIACFALPIVATPNSNR